MGQICLREARDISPSTQNKPRCIQPTYNSNNSSTTNNNNNQPAGTLNVNGSSSSSRTQYQNVSHLEVSKRKGSFAYKFDLEEFENMSSEKKYFFSLPFLNKINRKISLLAKKPNIKPALLALMEQSLQQYIDHLQTIVEKFRLIDQVYEESEMGYMESEAYSLTFEDSFRQNLMLMSTSPNSAATAALAGTPSSQSTPAKNNNSNNNHNNHHHRIYNTLNNSNLSRTSPNTYDESISANQNNTTSTTHTTNNRKTSDESMYSQAGYHPNNITPTTAIRTEGNTTATTTTTTISRQKMILKSHLTELSNQETSQEDEDHDKLLLFLPNADHVNSCESLLLVDTNNNTNGEAIIATTTAVAALPAVTTTPIMMKKRKTNSDEQNSSSDKHGMLPPVVEFQVDELKNQSGQFSLCGDKEQIEVSPYQGSTAGFTDSQNLSMFILSSGIDFNVSSQLSPPSMPQPAAAATTSATTNMNINNNSNTIIKMSVDVSEAFGRISERVDQPIVVLEFHRFVWEFLPKPSIIRSCRFLVEFLFEEAGVKKQRESFSTGVFDITQIAQSMNQVFEFLSEVDITDHTYKKFKITMFYSDKFSTTTTTSANQEDQLANSSVSNKSAGDKKKNDSLGESPNKPRSTSMPQPQLKFVGMHKSQTHSESAKGISDESAAAATTTNDQQINLNAKNASLPLRTTSSGGESGKLFSQSKPIAFLKETKLCSQIIDLSEFKDQKIHYMNIRFKTQSDNSSGPIDLQDTLRLTLQIRFQFVFNQRALITELMGILKSHHLTLCEYAKQQYQHQQKLQQQQQQQQIRQI